MSFILQPWHILLACLCGIVNHRQQQIIEFQNAQIEALLKKLGKKRLLLDDDQRRLLAVKAHAIGRKALLEITTIFTPDTVNKIRDITRELDGIGFESFTDERDELRDQLNESKREKLAEVQRLEQVERTLSADLGLAASGDADGAEPVGGAARFLTAVKAVSENVNPLILFSGDIFAPSISKSC